MEDFEIGNMVIPNGRRMLRFATILLAVENWDGTKIVVFVPFQIPKDVLRFYFNEASRDRRHWDSPSILSSDVELGGLAIVGIWAKREFPIAVMANEGLWLSRSNTGFVRALGLNIYWDATGAVINKNVLPPESVASIFQI